MQNSIVESGVFVNRHIHGYIQGLRIHGYSPKTIDIYIENYLNGIRPHLQANLEEKALFLYQFGQRYPYHTLRRRLHAYAGKAGIDIQVTPHTFRRSCTTELLRGGANMYHVKEMLGHESLDTLKHYARLTITDLKKTHRKCHPREREGPIEE
jgi:integrase/recombinase XerD